MPAISRIRFTNVVYENGAKRYNDEIFHFDGHSGAIVLENGGGKTVFIQTALQAIIPHVELADRKIKETLSLESGASHVAIEWITNESPRRYAVTAVTLFMENNMAASYKYAYEYGPEDTNSLENMPFVVKSSSGGQRPAGKGEMLDYYQKMARAHMNAKLFDSIHEFHTHIEDHFKIIPAEWRKIGVINSAEGDVEKFFEGCKTTPQLLNKLLIPVVEEALEGKYKQDFVKTFEKQQDHFKKNKLLMEQIRESSQLHEKLTGYMAVYKIYDEGLNAYQMVKRETKSVYRYLDSRLQIQKDHLLSTQNALEALTNRETAFKHQKESFSIWIRREEEKALQKTYDDQMSLYQRKTQDYREKSAKNQNLELTRMENDLLHLAAQRDDIQTGLKQLETDRDFAGLKQELDANGCALKYLLDQEILGIGRQKEEIALQSRHNTDEADRCAEQLKQAESERTGISKKQSALSTQISIIEKELSKQLPLLIQDTENSRIEDVYESLKSELKELQETVFQSSETLENEKSEKRDLERVRQSDYEKSLSLASASSRISQQLEDYAQAAKDMDRLIGPYMPSFYGNEHLYTRQKSIEQVLIEKENQLNKQKESALQLERKALILSEQYAHSACFTADPIIEKLVQRLKSMTDYVELGSRYADSLGIKSPVLAAGIVTTARDMALVKNKLDEIKDSISSPVWLFTTEDMKSLEPSIQNCIFPALWSDNLDFAVFEKWKDQIMGQAKEACLLRIEQEKALLEINTIKNQVEAFFSTYAYESLEALNREFAQAAAAAAVLKEEMALRQQRLDEIVLNSENLTIIMDLTKEAMVRVRDHIRLAESCIEKQATSEQLSRERIKLDEKELENIQTIETVKKSIKIFEGLLEQLRWDDRRMDDLKEQKLQMPLYVELMEVVGSPTDLGKDVLISARERLTDHLTGKNESYDSLRRQLKEKNEAWTKSQKNYKFKLDQAEYPVEHLELNDDLESERLVRQIKILRREMDELQIQMNKDHDRLIQVRTLQEDMTQRCENRFGSVHRFDRDMADTEKHLIQEESILRKERDMLNKKHESLHHEAEVLNLRLEELNRYDGRHEFLRDTVADIEISPILADEIKHNPKSIGEMRRQKLESARSLTDGQLVLVNRQKDSYKRYLTTELRDVRLKEMAMDGVENRKSYEDLKSYAKRMEEVIEQGIQFAEHARRTYDQELQIFLDHLFTYVVHVLNELDMIQNKTKIPTEGGLKQIFEFTIPTFEEAAAKEELRKHMDRIIEQLAQKSSEWDDEAVKKNLNQWLSVKSLIECILKDQPIKIKCRKVTNDKKITTTPFNWESSNQWSGGEKWSKNMSLFLGILIYMAEKKQFLTGSQKRQRTVILDNPFGKASSKHVLDPVFFIAERLGFQIIALTAHAEGDFIRNYFPVVYSCRLRQSAEVDKKIIVAEKEVHYAYLKENDPQALIRFQQTEQVTLDALLGL